MDPRATAPSGIVESVFHRLISSRATVHHVESVGSAFRLITLENAELARRRWRPGEMIQLGFTGFQGRAYTPFAIDPAAGTLEFLGYLHGDGVASNWLKSATVGEQVFFVGPRSAGLKLESMSRPLIFFGDETSFGTVAAFRVTREGLSEVTSFFEVASVAEARPVLERIGLTSHVHLTEREPGETHLRQLEEQLVTALRVTPEASCVFTGRASSIQHLYKAARVKCSTGDLPPA